MAPRLLSQGPAKLTPPPTVPTLPRSAAAQVARIVRDKVVQPAFRTKTKVFLCGAARDTPGSIRDLVQQDLASARSFEVYLPEELFADLVVGEQKENLLHLENRLANSVDVVALILESAGAIAELGAFANHEGLREKVVVIRDVRFAKDRSFLALGPIATLKAIDKSRVVDLDYADPDIRPLRRSLYQFARREHEPLNLSDVLHLPRYLLALIYVMGSVSREQLEAILIDLEGLDDEDARTLAKVGFRMLVHQRLAAHHGRELNLTALGFSRFRELTTQPRSTLQEDGLANTLDRSALDTLRIRILNWTHRRKMLG